MSRLSTENAGVATQSAKKRSFHNGILKLPLTLKSFLMILIRLLVGQKMLFLNKEIGLAALLVPRLIFLFLQPAIATSLQAKKRNSSPMNSVLLWASSKNLRYLLRVQIRFMVYRFWCFLPKVKLLQN